MTDFYLVYIQAIFKNIPRQYTVSQQTVIFLNYAGNFQSEYKGVNFSREKRRIWKSHIEINYNRIYRYSNKLKEDILMRN